MNTLSLITLALVAILLLPLLLVAGKLFAREKLVSAANTYDAAVAVHDSSITRTNDVAIAARHLLWQQGAGAGTVALGAAAAIPLGTIDNIETGTALRQSILLLGKGATKKMVASEAITAGEAVYTAANGKVQDLPTAAGTYYLVGTAVTASTADDQIIEVRDIAPVKVVIGTAVVLSNANGAIAALTFTALGATGAECEALRDKTESLADDVRALYTALQAAGYLA